MTSSLTNNKFQVENTELKRVISENEKTINEHQVKITLLRKAMSDLQEELKARSTLEEQIDTMMFERSEIKINLEKANDKIIELKSIIEEKDRELALPREIIIQAPPEDIFEPKYNQMNANYHELLDLYNEKCKVVESLERIVSNDKKHIIELENSIENINLSIEKFRNENLRLRKNLPVHF